MKPQLIGIVVILALLIAGAFFYGKQTLVQQPQQETLTGENLYANGTYGISFAYPSYYVLTEQEVGNAERGHYVITLVHTDDTAVPEAGEGPPAITIDIYQNDIDALTLDEWLETNASNFKLGDGVRASTKVALKEAVSYRWSGLYEGETTAFIHGNSLIAISATYLSRESQQRADYLALLTSFTAK